MRNLFGGSLFGSRSPDPDRVTAEDVVYCYRKLLQREPDSEDAIRAHMKAGSFRALVDIISSSEEFRQLVSRSADRPAHHNIGIGAAHNDVETDATPEVLARCLARVKRAWTHLGEQRPHFSVLSAKEYLPEAIDTNLEAFRKSGADDVNEIVAVLRRYLPEQRIGELAVNELGCGVGRMSVPMARHVGVVHGFDISPPHLAIAARYAGDTGANNVCFHPLDVGTLPSFPDCDLFFSKIVLQHNPPPLILALLRAMLRSIRPDGIAFFQVPTYIGGYRFDTEEWLRSEQTLEMEMHSVPMASVFTALREEGFAVREVRDEGYAPVAIISNIFVAQKAGGVGDS